MRKIAVLRDQLDEKVKDHKQLELEALSVQPWPPYHLRTTFSLTLA